MTQTTTYGISPLARRYRLPHIPGSSANAVYGVVEGDFCSPEGEESRYIVEFCDDVNVIILGFIASDGRVFAVNKPCASWQADMQPTLFLASYVGGERGCIYARGVEGMLARVGEYEGSQAHGMRFCGSQFALNMLMPYTVFIAQAFLRSCIVQHAPVTDASASGFDESAEPLELFLSFLRMPLFDALQALCRELHEAQDLVGAQRFALRELEPFNTDEMRDVLGRSLAEISYLEGTESFYLKFDRSLLEPEELVLIVAFEAALNRVVTAVCGDAPALDPVYPVPREELCAQRLTNALSAPVRRALELLRAPMDNPWACLGTKVCAREGQWDVRTRFAAACEGSQIPVRLEYRFDVLPGAQALNITFSGVAPQAVPASSFDSATRSWVPYAAVQRVNLAQELSSELALLLATAAFCASSKIQRCSIVQLDPAGSTATEAWEMSRAAFFDLVVPQLEWLQETPLEAGCASSVLDPLWTASPFEDLTSDTWHRSLQRDTRPIPQELRSWLLADSVYELEVMEDDRSPSMKRIAELRSLAHQDRWFAESGYRELIEELQAHLAAAELLCSEPVRTVFCENHVGRLLVPLVESDERTRIIRAPDALFLAHLDLTTMYLGVGNGEAAVQEAQALLDLAPTSAQAHVMLINALVYLGKFSEVIEVAKHGLRVVYDRESAAYLLYRLAYALWEVGYKNEALACYRLLPSKESMSAAAAAEMRALMAEMHCNEEPDVDWAKEQLKAADIALAPTKEVIVRIADLAVLLTDAGMPFLAGRCAYALWKLHASDVLGVVSRSLLD